MVRDELAAGLLLGSFAAWGTVHWVLVAKLFGSSPRWHGAMALVVPPLAPYWSLRRGARALPIAWIALLVAWAFARVFLAR